VTDKARSGEDQGISAPSGRRRRRGPRDATGQREIVVKVRLSQTERQRLARLNRINANLNMVARWVNTYKTRADAWAVVSRLEAIQAELSALLAAWEGKTDDRRVFGIRHRQR
jgi:hypothetical protein